MSETGEYGGKKSEPNKASVAGDMVIDLLHITASPSLHILIK
jgi:Na+/H+-translocating membrane pyrophosphatase